MKRYTIGKLCLSALLLMGILVCRQQFMRDRQYVTSGSGMESVGCRVETEDRVGEKPPEGEIIARGTVHKIEEKIDAYQQKQTLVILHSVTFCNKEIQEKQDKQNKSSNQGKPDNQGSSANQGSSDNQGGSEVKAEGILCYLQEGEELPLYGQQIVVRGEAQAFRVKRNPGGFHEALYYKSQGIDFALEKCCILKRGKSFHRFRQKMYELKVYFSKKLQEVCGEDAALMQSVFLGDKGQLSKELKNSYQEGGISHILAISGLHISFLGVGLYKLLKKVHVPMQMSAVISGMVLYGYVVMTGESASAVRAMLMFLLQLGADICQRTYERKTALALAACIQIFQQPYLFFQSGFWLSYGAVFGLEFVAPILQECWQGAVGELLSGGAAVTVVTLPILLNTYFEFPIGSLLLNFLVIPLMGIVMAGGIAALMTGCIMLPLGRALFLPVHIILLFFQGCCGVSGAIPGNMWTVGKPEIWQLILYGSLLLFFIYMGNKRKESMTSFYCMFALAAGVWILTGRCRIKDMVTMIDVGQGDCSVIQSRQGEAFLIDGGSTSESKLWEYTLQPYFKAMGIREIESIFLTHMDADHISGIQEMLAEEDINERIRIKALVLPKLVQPDHTYDELVNLAMQYGCKIYLMERGDCMGIGGFQLLCLHPEEGYRYADKNEASLVLYVKKKAFSALFMGDVDGNAEVEFAKKYPSRLSEIDLLKVGHHGAKNSCGEDFLSAVSASYAVISCGENNSYGHPHPETLARLSGDGTMIFRTPACGAVQIEIGEDVKVSGFLGN